MRGKENNSKKQKQQKYLSIQPNVKNIYKNNALTLRRDNSRSTHEEQLQQIKNTFENELQGF